MLKGNVPVIKYNNNVIHSPLVSISVLTYNHVNYIKQCLESILMQKADFPIELLLGEDESNDGTREICIEYANRYPEKIRLFLHSRENNIKINGKPTGRFNFLYNLSKARGKYIALCEGDDYWTDPLKLQKQVEFLEGNEEYSACFHETQQIFHETGVVGKVYGAEAPLAATTIDFFSKVSLFHTSSLCFKREAYVHPVWMQNVVSGDMAIFSILSKYGPLRKLPEVMSVYRKHAAGLTNRKDVIESFHHKRIELMSYLNEFHDYRFSEKADLVVNYHKDEIFKLGKSTNRNMLKNIRKSLSKVENHFHRLFKINA